MFYFVTKRIPYLCGFWRFANAYALILLKGYCRLEDVVSVCGMIVFGILIMLQIVLRAMGKTGITWLEEFSRYMFIVSTFIGCSQAVSTNGHVAMDMLYTILPEQFGQLLQCLVNTIMAIFCCILVNGGYRYMLKLKSVGTMADTLSWFPKWLIWIPLNICLCTMALRWISNIFKSVKKFLQSIKSSESKC